MTKKITITLEIDLNDRWTKTAKRLKLSKSGMVAEYLEQMLPILEEEQPSKLLQKAMKQMAKGIDETANLFDIGTKGSK